MTTLKLVAGVAFLALVGAALAPMVKAKPAENTGKLPPASAKQGVTYAADIKPILENSCVKCHSGDKPKARLRLDSLKDILKGGRDGKVVIPGDSAKSLLVLNAAHLNHDKDQWMPPKKFEDKFPPLTPGQIGLIRAWIDQGAK